MDHRSLAFTVALAFAVAPIHVAVAQSASPPSASAAAIDREAFARRIQRVHSGMSRNDVRAILGAPDDTLTRIDPELSPPSIVTEVWSYGASRHGAFASIGSVAFRANGTVFETRGGEGHPIALAGVSESQRRDLFGLLAALPGLRGGDYDPRPVIRAVNALRPLGVARALDVIAEYIRIAPTWTEHGTEGIFLVLRALFVPNGGAPHPTMFVGAPSTAQPASGAPAFPLVIVDDIPLFAISGYMLGGMPQQPESHLAFYRSSASLRAAPLRPGDHPLAAFEHFERSPAGAALLGPRTGNDAMVMEQLLRLVAGAYEPPLVTGASHLAWAPADPHTTWRTIVPAYDAIGARWDATSGEYVRPGASPTVLPRAPRVLWTRVHRGANAEVFLERISTALVRTWVHFEPAVHGAPTSGGIEFVANTPAHTVLAQQPLAGYGSYGVTEIPLARGGAVIIRFTREASVIEESVTLP